MFRKIADGIQYPEWAKRWTRYRRLDLYDRLLDGTFYDHLKYAFYDEMEGSGEGRSLIPIAERRPSAQFRLPRMVSRWSARKLFAGRHRPKIRLPKGTDGKQTKNSKPLANLNGMLRRARFWQTMAEAVLRGSVGSVGVTFRVEDTGAKARLVLTVWKAKYCQPSFDEFRQLAQLRIAYHTSGAGLMAGGTTKDHNGAAIAATSTYWFIRDYTKESEVTYAPPLKDEWNPCDGFVGDASKNLIPGPDKTVEHKLGFVPGHWFINLAGGEGEDGDCTWSDAIPNSIEMDYTLSQLGRGTRYNAAPQLVVIGNLLNGEITRGPMSALQVGAGYKEEDGQTIGAGDAKLLEMTGTGIKAGLELIDKLRNFALEQIAAARKDPDKMKAPLSGRAMEYLDEESNDLVMDLRSQYGEDGALVLIRKIALAAVLMNDKEAGTLKLQWPRLFQPTPDELFALVQALQLAVDPLGHASPMQPGQPKKPGKPASATAPASPDTPEVQPTEAQTPDEETQFMTIEQAKAYLTLNMDLEMLDIESDGDEEQVDDSPTPPGDPTDPVPQPVLIDLDAEPNTPEADAPHDNPSLASATASAVAEE